MRWQTVAKVGAILMLGSLLVAGQEQGTLGDAARRAKQKQGNKPKPTVYTEENLPQGTISVVGTATPPPAAPGAGGQPTDKTKPAGAGGAGGASGAAGTDEAGSAEYQQALERLETLKKDEQTMIKRYQNLEERMNAATSDYTRESYRDSLSRRDEVLAAKRKEIEDLQKQVDAMAPKAKGKKPAKPAPAAEQPPPQ